MLDNIPENLQYCKDVVEATKQVLYYSHIPTVFLSLFVSFFVYFKNKTSKLAKALVLISLCFSLWSICDLGIWLSYDNAPVLMFLWSLMEIFSVLLFILLLYFLYSFTTKKEVPIWSRSIIAILFLPIILLSPTNFNLISFDAQECIAVENPLITNYVLSIKILLSLWMLFLIIKAPKNIDPTHKKKMNILSVGVLSFIFSFLISGMIAAHTEYYVFEMYGLVAMVVFIISLAHLIIVYKEFNFKILTAQVFVVGLVALIGSQFAFIQMPINMLLNSIAFLGSIYFGWLLIHSVKREVEQREKIERLAKELGEANDKLKQLDQMKSEFLSLATHQIRSPLTSIKGYASLLLEGDYGNLDARAKEGVQTIYNSCDNLVKIVGDFLNISRIEQGRMVYNKETFDIVQLTAETTNEYKPDFDKAGIALKINLPEGAINVNADKIKIKQIIGNLIDNAIKYTPKGNIEVSVFEEKNKIKVSVKDTGIGIDKNEMIKLFNKFSRTKDAHLTNVTGTGLGLYVAKKMAEAQGFDITVSSPGSGQGSTFTLEIPKI